MLLLPAEDTAADYAPPHAPVQPVGVHRSLENMKAWFRGTLVKLACLPLPAKEQFPPHTLQQWWGPLACDTHPRNRDLVGDARGLLRSLTFAYAGQHPIQSKTTWAFPCMLPRAFSQLQLPRGVRLHSHGPGPGRSMRPILCTACDA